MIPPETVTTLWRKKFREAKATIPGEYCTIVSLATPDGGVAGVRTEVNRYVAARMIAKGEALLGIDSMTPRDILRMVAVDALDSIISQLTIGNLVNRDFQPLLAQVGDVVDVPVGTDDGLGNVQIVLDSHIEATFAVTDIHKALTIPGILRTYMEPAAIAIAEAIESQLLNLYAGFTANAPLGTAGTPATEVIISQAVIDTRIPLGEPRFLMVSGATFTDISRMPNLDTSNNDHGAAGRISNFFLFRSQYVPKTGIDTVSTHNLAFADGAIGMVIRRLPMPIPGTGVIAEYAECGDFGIRVIMDDSQRAERKLTIDILYGCGILRNDHGVQVTT